MEVFNQIDYLIDTLNNGKQNKNKDYYQQYKYLIELLDEIENEKNNYINHYTKEINKLNINKDKEKIIKIELISLISLMILLTTLYFMINSSFIFFFTILSCGAINVANIVRSHKLKKEIDLLNKATDLKSLNINKYITYIFKIKKELNKLEKELNNTKSDIEENTSIKSINNIQSNNYKPLTRIRTNLKDKK